MPLYYTLSGSQSDSGPFKLFRPVQTLKDPEQFICVLHVKACSVVPYEKLCLVFVTVGTANLDFGPRSHPCELDRIGTKVREDDFQHRTVPVTCRERPDFPNDVPSACFLRKFRDNLRDKPIEVHHRLFGLGTSDPGKPQQVVDQVTHSFCRLDNRLYVATTLVIKRSRRLFLQQLRVSNHVAKWRTQVVRHRIGKRFQFLVARFEFRRLLGEFLIELADFLLSALALFQFDLKPIARLTKTVLDTASSSAEPSDD